MSLLEMDAVIVFACVVGDGTGRMKEGMTYIISTR